MILNLRGTHGSGKSTVVRTILERLSQTVTLTGATGKIEGYSGLLTNGARLLIVGSYKNACGGCDTIQPYSLIWPRIELYAQHGHVLFEGALVSSSYGNIGRASEAYGSQFVFAFMNTPLAVCLDRVCKRREERGNLKPLDPKNTQGKYDNILKTIPKIRNELGRRTVMIDYRRPVGQVLGLFYNAR